MDYEETLEYKEKRKQLDDSRYIKELEQKIHLYKNEVKELRELLNDKSINKNNEENENLKKEIENI
ncbi:hypothetical protein BCR36DRAFT_586397 [Piromyces finnis]|uniref:Uncharacterized protein n=1 Tax=Piromyces finnis TaxID=1754191 RepID=A0A1Y1UZH6_9FUNG|nr:hypothetical protein BCR36DRAFT_586397 [Piromyces finnis]|eukprot:ORX43931.1 hypothetical protein BCR36DRAFT_586397 [Piromyces finnis]